MHIPNNCILLSVREVYLSNTSLCPKSSQPLYFKLIIYPHSSLLFHTEPLWSLLVQLMISPYPLTKPFFVPVSSGGECVLLCLHKFIKFSWLWGVRKSMLNGFRHFKEENLCFLLWNLPTVVAFTTSECFCLSRFVPTECNVVSK